jgi:hypothetical protein
MKLTMKQITSSSFYLYAPFYFGFRKPDAVGGA